MFEKLPSGKRKTGQLRPPPRLVLSYCMRDENGDSGSRSSFPRRERWIKIAKESGDHEMCERKPKTKRRGKPRTEQKIRERQTAFRFIENEHVEFEVSGDLAMFSDPLVSIGGERTTYSVPTCEAVEGVTKSV